MNIKEENILVQLYNMFLAFDSKSQKDKSKLIKYYITEINLVRKMLLVGLV